MAMWQRYRAKFIIFVDSQRGICETIPLPSDSTFIISIQSVLRVTSFSYTLFFIFQNTFLFYQPGNMKFVNAIVAASVLAASAVTAQKIEPLVVVLCIEHNHQQCQHLYFENEQCCKIAPNFFASRSLLDLFFLQTIRRPKDSKITLPLSIPEPDYANSSRKHNPLVPFFNAEPS
jgi:hypothetical protein